MSDSTLHIVFCGTSAFAVPSLQALIVDDRFAVDAVCTQPDRPVGRKQVLTPPPVKELAEKFHLSVHQPTNIQREFESLSLARPDFLVVVSYGQILSQEILNFPQITAVNVHASLLPRWRGASPIQHALLTGDAETGVTVQQMVEKLDAGPILAQERTRLAPRETTESLHDLLAEMGAHLLLKTLHSPLRAVQQDETLVTMCHKLTRADGIVDFTHMTAETIDRRVRALNPWPGVSTTIDDQPLKILATDLQPHTDSHPLPCKDHTILHLVRVQSPGKRAISGAEWARGKHEQSTL